MLNLKSLYTKLWRLLIRPARVSYGEEDLGPKFVVLMEDKFAFRLDFEIKNAFEETLRLSVYLPCDQSEKPLPMKGAIVYCHTHSGCRVEGLQLLAHVLKADCALVLFDFSASGHSTGDFVTLGWKEALDLHAVVTFVKSQLRAHSLGLWGRSMGAAAVVFFFSSEWRKTAEELLRLKGKKPIVWPKSGAVDAIVLDSCFGDLSTAVWNLVQEKAPVVPRALVNALFSLLDKSIKEKIGISARLISPADHIHDIHIPLFMTVGSRDELVSLEMCREMLSCCGAEIKELRVFDARHAEERPEAVLCQAIAFLLGIFKHKREYNKTKSISCIEKSNRPPPKPTLLRKADPVKSFSRTSVSESKSACYNPLQVIFSKGVPSVSSLSVENQVSQNNLALKKDSVGEGKAFSTEKETSKPLLEKACIFEKHKQDEIYSLSLLNPWHHKQEKTPKVLKTPRLRSTARGYATLRVSKSLQSLDQFETHSSNSIKSKSRPKLSFSRNIDSSKEYCKSSPSADLSPQKNVFLQSSLMLQKTRTSTDDSGVIDQLVWNQLPEFRSSAFEDLPFLGKENSSELQRMFEDGSDYFDQFSADPRFDVLHTDTITIH